MYDADVKGSPIELRWQASDLVPRTAPAVTNGSPSATPVAGAESSAESAAASGTEGEEATGTRDAAGATRSDSIFSAAPGRMAGGWKSRLKLATAVGAVIMLLCA